MFVVTSSDCSVVHDSFLYCFTNWHWDRDGFDRSWTGTEFVMRFFGIFEFGSLIFNHNRMRTKIPNKAASDSVTFAFYQTNYLCLLIIKHKPNTEVKAKPWSKKYLPLSQPISASHLFLPNIGSLISPLLPLQQNLWQILDRRRVSMEWHWSLCRGLPPGACSMLSSLRSWRRKDRNQFLDCYRQSPSYFFSR